MPGNAERLLRDAEDAEEYGDHDLAEWLREEYRAKMNTVNSRVMQRDRADAPICALPECVRTPAVRHPAESMRARAPTDTFGYYTNAGRDTQPGLVNAIHG